MVQTLVDLMSSKKFTTAQLGIIVLVAMETMQARLVSEAAVAAIIAAAILAQGLADHGKEAAKVEANNAG